MVKIRTRKIVKNPVFREVLGNRNFIFAVISLFLGAGGTSRDTGTSWMRGGSPILCHK